ncbi:MAG TPA: OmpA family protein [Candidatus Omnitrophota bacterium]|nr:OmpA family protein [Candidatus Omnitrophota bacterium]HRY85292.1 OmpA family protein [Candidatus Omnitrophota bacterium]
MFCRNVFCAFSLFFFAVLSHAAANDQNLRQLVRQQSATIESLNHEVLRLNQELEGAGGSFEDLRGAQLQIEKNLAAPIVRGDVKVTADRRGLIIAVLDHALFDPDEAQLTTAGEEILQKVALTLSGGLAKNPVMLEGHTDDQPIEGAEGVTNWEYSIGRAVAVLHYFLDVQNLAPARFGVAGYGEYRPVASNAAEEGRDRNRRVEIVIMPQRSSYELAGSSEVS